MQWCVSDLTGPWDRRGAGLSGSQWHKAMQHVNNKIEKAAGVGEKKDRLRPTRLAFASLLRDKKSSRL